jgi:hypothetical protein
MLEQVVIPADCNGPPGLGNGGYVAGLLASRVAGDAEVRLSRGFPVAVPLAILRGDDGMVRCRLDGEELGWARPVELHLRVPPPPALDEARAASARFQCIHRSAPRGCFVCSPLRGPKDGLRLFCGPLAPPAARRTGNLVAGVWEPGERWRDASGHLAPVHVWAALDCPGGYAIAARSPQAGRQMLGTCTASLRQPLAPGERYIVSGWEIAPPAGRKRFMGVAIHDAGGGLRACASQIWIQSR